LSKTNTKTDETQTFHTHSGITHTWIINVI